MRMTDKINARNVITTMRKDIAKAMKVQFDVEVFAEFVKAIKEAFIMKEASNIINATVEDRYLANMATVINCSGMERAINKVNKMCKVAELVDPEAAAPKWISVEEPPKNMRKVFVYTFDGKMAVTYYNPLSKMWDFNHDYKITHWMPLPEPPKDKAKAGE